MLPTARRGSRGGWPRWPRRTMCRSAPTKKKRKDTSARHCGVISGNSARARKNKFGTSSRQSAPNKSPGEFAKGRAWRAPRSCWGSPRRVSGLLENRARNKMAFPTLRSKALFWPRASGEGPCRGPFCVCFPCFGLGLFWASSGTFGGRVSSQRPPKGLPPISPSKGRIARGIPQRWPQHGPKRPKSPRHPQISGLSGATTAFRPRRPPRMASICLQRGRDAQGIRGAQGVSLEAPPPQTKRRQMAETQDVAPEASPEVALKWARPAAGPSFPNRFENADVPALRNLSPVLAELANHLGTRRENSPDASWRRAGLAACPTP